MFSKARITRTAPLAAVVALMAVPAVSQAQTYTFGSRLDHEPSNSAPGHNCNEDGNNDEPTPACTRVAIDKSIAVPGGLTAPKPADQLIGGARPAAGQPQQGPLPRADGDRRRAGSAEAHRPPVARHQGARGVEGAVGGQLQQRR